MGLVRSMDNSVTTAVVDSGFMGVLPVWVSDPIDEVEADLLAGKFVHGDSSIGEVRFALQSVKFLQRGRRELNQVAPNRPSNLPL